MPGGGEDGRLVSCGVGLEVFFAAAREDRGCVEAEMSEYRH